MHALAETSNPSLVEIVSISALVLAIVVTLAGQIATSSPERQKAKSGTSSGTKIRWALIAFVVAIAVSAVAEVAGVWVAVELLLGILLWFLVLKNRK